MLAVPGKQVGTETEIDSSVYRGINYRDGPQCEKCKENHYLPAVKDNLGHSQACQPCDCHPDGEEPQ